MQNANVAAVNLLVVECVTHTGTSTVSVRKFSTEKQREFSLANPDNRDAVVQALGDKHDISIIKSLAGWTWENANRMIKGEESCSYEDCVRAAVMEVSDYENP